MKRIVLAAVLVAMVSINMTVVNAEEALPRMDNFPTADELAVRHHANVSNTLTSLMIGHEDQIYRLNGILRMQSIIMTLLCVLIVVISVWLLIERKKQ